MRLMPYLKFIGNLFVSKFSGRRVPLIVILCVTNRCNLGCWYCYGEHPYRKDWPDFTTKELLNIVRTLHKSGTQILQFQGGEPLMRSDLDVIIKEARQLGMICDMVTNGTLITQRQKAIRLLDKICISLDGPELINNQNRGKGSHARVIDGIEIACSLGLPVRISSVLTAESTEEDIDWLLDFAQKRKISVNFSPSFEFISLVRGKNFKPHNIPDNQLRNLFGYIIKHKNKRDPVQFTAGSYEVASKWPFSYQKRTARAKEIPPVFSYPKCYHGRYVFFIDSDGGLYPCCNFWGHNNTPNIRELGLEQSIADLNHEDCASCHIPAYIDRNLFFSGNPAVWWNYARDMMRGVR